MKSLSQVIESIIAPGYDPSVDYTTEYGKWCKANKYANDVKSIVYNDKTNRFDVTIKGNDGSFRVLGDRIDGIQWDKLPYGVVNGVFEMAYVDSADITNLPTECGGLAIYGCTLVGSKPHTCKIIDYTPSSNTLYYGEIEIVKNRGAQTKFKNTGKLTFDVSGTNRITGNLKPFAGGGVATRGCRLQPNAQKPDDILKRIELIGN